MRYNNKSLFWAQKHHSQKTHHHLSLHDLLQRYLLININLLMNWPAVFFLIFSENAYLYLTLLLSLAYLQMNENHTLTATAPSMGLM